MSERPILIAGGGIGGLAAALALARAGFACHVLEQSDSFGEIGAGIQLSPNVFRMFRHLGLHDTILEDAVTVDAIRMMDAVSGEGIAEIPVDAGYRTRFGEPYAVTHRGDLHRTLLEACLALPDRIALETGAKLTGFEEAGDGVTATLEDGRGREGMALIGCDGLWSKVREAIVGDGKPRVSGHIAYRAVLPIQEVPEDVRWNAACLWAGPRIHLVHYPLRRWTLFNLVAVFHSDRYVEGWDLAGDTAELHRHFTGVDERPATLLQKIESWRYWVLCDREPVSEWSRGRVTLLGDAAHPMLQYFAQGACMAIEDAVVLADCLADMPTHPASAFQAYQKKRYLRTARVQLMARLLGEIYHAEGVRADLRKHVLGQRTPEQAWEGLAWLHDGP